jgi:hypothetical protein
VSEVLQSVEAALVEHFGHRPVRASVSFVGVDPIEVLRFEPIPGERAYVSLGMSRHPMTGADQSMLASSGPRAELMLHLDDPTDEHADVWRRIALLAAAPAVEGVVYADGHSVEVGEPLVAGSACVGVLITSSPLEPVPAGDEAGDQVDFLQVVPATANELAWCRVRGSAALRERWDEHGTDLLDLMRRSVALD